jgi:hydrogenase expression/formation protein HypC
MIALREGSKRIGGSANDGAEDSRTAHAVYRWATHTSCCTRSHLMCLAIPGRVVDLVDQANRLAKVDVAGVRRNVNVGLLDSVEPGDWVLIHVGFALSKVDEDEAQATLQLLQQMGEAYEQELEDLKTSVIQ